MGAPHASYFRKQHRDSTHKEIAETLQAFGWTVLDTSAMGRVVPGYPDMQIGGQGVDNMVEAKRDPSAKMRASQVEFARTWRGAPIIRMDSKADAEAWARNTRHERSRVAQQKQIEWTGERRPRPPAELVDRLQDRVATPATAVRPAFAARCAHRHETPVVHTDASTADIHRGEYRGKNEPGG